MELLDQIPLINRIPLDIRVGITRVLIALVVFALFWFLRYAVAALITRPIRRRVEETDSEGDDVLVDAITNFASYLMVGLAILAGIVIIGLTEGFFLFFRSIALTLIAYGLFKALYDLASFLIASQERVENYTPFEVEPQVIPLLRNGFKLLVVALGVTVIAQVWGISIAGLVAGLGLAGLAFSLAAKEVLDDFFAFLVIIGDDVYAPDEYIVSPHAEGIVETIGLRSTRVRQLNQGLVIAPNASMVNDSVLNWSRLEKRWLNFTVGITYQSSAEQVDEFAKRVRQMLIERETVEDDSVAVLFTEFEDSALSLMVRAYIKIEDFIEAKAERHRVNLEIMRILDKVGVEVAFPSRSLYMEQIPAIGLANRGDDSGDGRSSNGWSGEGELHGETLTEGGQDEQPYDGGDQASSEAYSDGDDSY